MRLELRRNTTGNKRHQYELRAETSTMSYSANNYGPQLFPRNEGPKLLIGVHDKRTGVVRLVAAQQRAEKGRPGSAFRHNALALATWGCALKKPPWQCLGAVLAVPYATAHWPIPRRLPTPRRRSSSTR